MGSSRAVFVSPDEPSRPGEMSLKVGASDTAGLLGAVEAVVPFGYSPNLHVHRREDEVFYVLEGTVGFVCGDDRFTGEAGAFVFLPRGVPHTFLGRSAPGARVLMLFVPGGLERTFVATGDAEHATPPEEQGIEVVGPPLTM
jgi:mannose-6-phosphate isomerase-like protein (cupin superfamily)